MENLMMLTDKCAKDFHKWFIDKYDLFDDKDPIRKAMLQFYRLPHSMKFGVYVDFFTENGRSINALTTERIKAIQKANELYNGKK